MLRTFAGFRCGTWFWGRAQPAHGSKLRAAVTEQEPPPRREERARFAFILFCYLRHSSRSRTPRPLFHSGIITVQFPSASSMGEDCMPRSLRPVGPPRSLPRRVASTLLFFLFLLLLFSRPSLFLYASLFLARLCDRESFFVFFPHLSAVLILPSFSSCLFCHGVRSSSILAETCDGHVSREHAKIILFPLRTSVIRNLRVKLNESIFTFSYLWVIIYSSIGECEEHTRWKILKRKQLLKKNSCRGFKLNFNS